MLSMERSEALVAELDSPGFRRINGTVRALLEQLALASLGFGIAFLLAWMLAGVWLDVPYDGWGLAVHGLAIALLGGVMLHVTNATPSTGR